MSSAAILGPGGTIARRLSNYEARPQQLAMADAVADAIADRRHLMVEAGTGVGKALALDTPIPTPTGWASMGSLQVGDRVFDERGIPCRVTQKSQVFVDHACYRVVFNDGAELIADADHLWLTYDWSAKKALLRGGPDRPALRTTETLAATLWHPSGRHNHQIPVAGMLYLPEVDLPIDPYVLGYWLGDGVAIRPHVVTADDEVLAEIQRIGYVVRKVPSARLAWHVTVPNAKEHGYGAKRTLTTLLKEVGVFGCKHIPLLYLRASHRQRLALLEGLMDADGHARPKRGDVEITLTNLRLAADAYELVISLGYKPCRSHGGTRLTWRSPEFVFRLLRKRNNQKCITGRNSPTRWRVITAVDSVPFVPTQCITVDSPSRLYLAGRAMIPTHNSFSYLVPALLAATADKECRVVISTHTISLQEQLVYKDIPFLQEVLPQEFRAVLVKGRSNYLSLRRLRGAQQRVGALLADDIATEQLQKIGRWSRRTQDGSKSDLDFQPLSSVWDLVESDSGNCLGRNCADYQKCFYFKARRQIYGANLLVVNHALFFSDLALRRAGASLLPEYKVAILDEAHTLEDVAADHLGLQVTRGQIDYLLNKLHSPRHGRGLLAYFGTAAALRQLEATRFAAERFFADVLAWHERQKRSARGTFNGRVRTQHIIPNLLTEELKKLASCLRQIADQLDDEENKVEVDAAVLRCQALGGEIEQWLEQALPDQVYWVELSGERVQRIALASAPVEVGPALREQLYDKVPTVVLTSATPSRTVRSH